MEVVVSDDASEDSSPEILKDFASRSPIPVRLNLEKTRIGMKENFLRNLNRCEGVFVALLDGDDEWTCRRKLQLQAKYLEKNLEFASVFHKVKLVTKNDNLICYLPPKDIRKVRAETSDLLRYESFMPTSSIMFRNFHPGGWPDWLFELENIVDLPLNLLLSTYGSIGYLDRSMGIYRTQSSSTAFTARTPNLIMEESIRMYEVLLKNLPILGERELRQNISITRAALESHRAGLQDGNSLDRND